MSTPSVSLRLAVTTDIRAIADMSRDCIETGLGWSWQPMRVARFIARSDVCALVADDGGRLAGFALMEFGDEHAHLSLLAVAPRHRRTGLGTRLMNWQLQSALTAGIASIHLELRVVNQAARRFYRALGFTEGAYIPGYYGGREMALRMQKALRPSSAPVSWRWQLPAPPASER